MELLKRNSVAKTKKKTSTRTPYSPTKVKARNFLSNISYRRIADKDFKRKNFIIGVFTYLTIDLKPFFLHATFNEKTIRKWCLCFGISAFRQIFINS